ncbi:MAG: SDR family oxidoreductase [Dehalococcoidia bacterium]|jgi:NAD(P)-dependent dehydrogenase (short-subunit alcohol dehydrogenase family)
MDLSFRNKVVVVTGGGSGVGREITRLFCEAGATIIVADLVLEKADETARILSGLPGKTIAMKADITNYVEVKEMMAEAVKITGKVDILVNNAGFGVLKNFGDTTPDDWMVDLGVNLFGTLHCTRELINHMIVRKYGKIINIVSDAGRVGEAFQATYSAAKAAVMGFSKALAREVGQHGININCVSLGATKTPLIMPFITPEIEQRLIKAYPLRRLGLPQEPAALVVFLASDSAAWITGQVYSVNGGFSMI